MKIGVSWATASSTVYSKSQELHLLLERTGFSRLRYAYQYYTKTYVLTKIILHFAQWCFKMVSNIYGFIVHSSSAIPRQRTWSEGETSPTHSDENGAM